MGIQVIFNKFTSLGETLIDECKNTEQNIGNDAVKNIQQHIVANGQVATGNMLNSVVADGDTITVGAEYAVYQNYGTRYLPPRPFFEPGLDDTQDDIEQELERIVSVLESM